MHQINCMVSLCIFYKYNITKMGEKIKLMSGIYDISLSEHFSKLIFPTWILFQIFIDQQLIGWYWT